MISRHAVVALATMLLAVPVQAATISVVSNAVEDGNYLGNSGNGQDRFETIVGLGRYAASRFDTAPIAPYAAAPWATLTSAKLVLTEQSGRDTIGANNGQTVAIGAFFMNTAENAGWTAASIDNESFVWHGNSQARPGDFGGGAGGGDNNVDARSTSDPIEAAGNTFRSGVSQQTHTFVPGVLDVVEIDLTEAGGTLADIQAILAEWVAGDNAGLGLDADFNDQVFFRSVGTAAGTEGGSGTGVPGALANGSDLAGVGGVARLELTFEIPEPGSVVLSLLALAGLGSVAARGRQA